MALMPPRTVREAWGEEVATDFADWFEFVIEERAVKPVISKVDAMLKERAVSKDEFRQILSRLDILEQDVAELKAEVKDLRKEMNQRFDLLYSEMNQRFDRVNERFDRLYSEMNERFDRMNERFDQMYERMLSMTRWTVGTLALFGTIITILLAVGQFMK